MSVYTGTYSTHSTYNILDDGCGNICAQWAPPMHNTMSVEAISAHASVYRSSPHWLSYNPVYTIAAINPVVESAVKYPTEFTEQEAETDNDACIVCFVNSASACIVDCGHKNCCVKCLRGIKKCPSCRIVFTHIVRTFT